ncbi:MAG TPA: sigma-70 family RNA polymerase sigma factor [Gemmataceae bacterium]|jgi:RNA polymerase sigma-70 factor (ECF subfamily)|nr:sigma-70 family RNA polymerase sigma factor [Gemmataceae bacterium]
MNATTEPTELIRQARAGTTDALGALLARYGNYLDLLARVQVGRRLQGKVDPADLVQETFLEAHRHFVGFRGQSEPEVAAWLRQIMAGVLSNMLRRYFGTKGRDIRLERELAGELDQSSQALDRGFADRGPTPSVLAVGRERAVLLADALGQLPDDYREAIILRNLQELPFAEVAKRMGRSEDAVQKLWVRALAKLRTALDGEDRP